MKKSVIPIVSAVLLLAVAWIVWQWGFCRFYVAPDQMAVVTAKSGDALPPGQILATEGQKGIRADVLAEGRHFRNPILYRMGDPAGVHDSARQDRHRDLQGGCGIAHGRVSRPTGGRKGSGGGYWAPVSIASIPTATASNIMDAISIPIGYAG